MTTRPLARITLRVSARKSVDLPAPEAPITASCSPASIWSVTSLRAATPSKPTEMSSSRTLLKPLLLFRDEVELTGLLFHVVVVAGLDLLIVLGPEQIQKFGVLYAEERVGECLLVLV